MGNASCCVRSDASRTETTTVGSSRRYNGHADQVEVGFATISPALYENCVLEEIIYASDDKGSPLQFQYVNQSFPRDETSTNFLPHISEREMGDGE